MIRFIYGVQELIILCLNVMTLIDNIRKSLNHTRFLLASSPLWPVLCLGKLIFNCLIAWFEKAANDRENYGRKHVVTIFRFLFCRWRGGIHVCNRGAGEGSSPHDGLSTSASTIPVWSMPAKEDAGWSCNISGENRRQASPARVSATSTTA